LHIEGSTRKRGWGFSVTYWRRGGGGSRLKSGWGYSVEARLTIVLHQIETGFKTKLAMEKQIFLTIFPKPSNRDIYVHGIFEQKIVKSVEKFSLAE